MGRPATRQAEVLSLLARYGVMDIATLTQLLDHAPSQSTIREVLSTLKKKQLIKCGTLKIGGTPSNYWQLSKDKSAIERILAITGLSASKLRLKSCHWSQFPHENLCTLFQASIEKQMPSVIVLREAANDFSKLPDHLISERIKENGYLPDLCLGIPVFDPPDANTPKFYRWVAVEIDRTNRSKKRIAARTNIYSRHTAFNGLLYLMPDERMASQLSKIYDTRGARDSLRIEKGKKSFLARGTVSHTLFDCNKMMLLCDDQEISLSTWTALISATDMRSRDELLLRISDGAAG